MDADEALNKRQQKQKEKALPFKKGDNVKGGQAAQGNKPQQKKPAQIPESSSVSTK